MNIIFDTVKDASNIKKHGVSLGQASQLEWNTALIWVDNRFDYKELRECALALLGDRLFYVTFVDRAEGRRIISLRKANSREVKRYVLDN
jgi:uncharacterized DUF497 family protein